MHWTSCKCFILSVCACSLRYPARNANASYYYLWPVRFYNIFPDYITNGTIFEKQVIEHKMRFDFLYNFRLKHFLFYEELSEIWSKMYIGLHVNHPLFLSDFNDTWIFSTDYRQILVRQIPWKSGQWEPSCSMQTGGRTERHDGAKSRPSQLSRTRPKMDTHRKITENCTPRNIKGETSEHGRISLSPLLQNAASIALLVVTGLEARQLRHRCSIPGGGILLYKASKADLRSTQPPLCVQDTVTAMRSWPITSNRVLSSIMWSHTDTAPIRLHGVHRNNFICSNTIQNDLCSSTKRYVRRECRPRKRAILVRRDNVQRLTDFAENNWMRRIWTVTGLRSVGAFI